MSRQFKLMLVTLTTVVAVSFYLLAELAQSEGARPSGRASASARQAERDHLLVRRLAVPQGMVAVGGDTLRIGSAWVERRSMVKYRYFLWGGRKVPIDGYVLAFTELNPGALPSGVGLTLGDSAVTWSRRNGEVPGRMVQYVRIAEPIPDTLRIRPCAREPLTDRAVLQRCPE